MNGKFFVLTVIALAAVSIALFGCKGKVERPVEEPTVVEAAVTETALQQDAMLAAAKQAQQIVVEPAASVASEAIPPTAAVQQAAKEQVTGSALAIDRNKEIQTALKNAGFYTGAIDGKVGPKTTAAIKEFQKAKALKVDGKVGPKTWAELEKYLLKQ
jgi:murein L,D-transpeptidase YcbB/YkuD